ncbi:YtxH domain-containing protein [Metabacillus sp. RGM 3146]|uniref:YtxH domain-containing protein n=1 Tax=Metabacillus sp. RGM 3146 TaxID=3401092 RepID=UPI003B9C844A
MGKSKSILTGALLGTVVGGLAILLSAPSSGKDLRIQLKSNREKLMDTLNHLKKDSMALKDQVIQTAKDSADVMKEVSTDLQTSIKEWQDEIEPHRQNLQNEIEAIEQKIKQLEDTLKK